MISAIVSIKLLTISEEETNVTLGLNRISTRIYSDLPVHPVRQCKLYWSASHRSDKLKEYYTYLLKNVLYLQLIEQATVCDSPRVNLKEAIGKMASYKSFYGTNRLFGSQSKQVALFSQNNSGPSFSHKKGL